MSKAGTGGVSREVAKEMADAHGSHDIPREGCPICERRELSEYRTAEQIRTDRLYYQDAKP